MIRSFRSKGLRRFAEKGDPSKLSVQNPDRISRMLSALNVAWASEQLDVPGWRFHALAGDRKGEFSLTVSGNWRITFKFAGDDVIDVDLEDYH